MGRLFYPHVHHQRQNGHMHDLLLLRELHNQLLLIMNITLNVTKDQYEMIIKALDYFNEGLKERLAHQAQMSVIKDQEKTEWTVTALDDSKLVQLRKARAKSTDAPYGYKKDGTPKQRPGRKTA